MAMGRAQMSKQISKPPQNKKNMDMPRGLTYFRKGGAASRKSKGSKICPAGKAWAKRTFDTYPSAYANMAASKYCKDPNYAKGSKGKKKK
jgi:hypothetical protein